MKKGGVCPLLRLCILSCRLGRDDRSARADHHDHLPTFQLWHVLDLANLGDIVGDAVQQIKPKLLVRHLAPAEAQRDLDLVPLIEEFHDRAHLDFVIMGIGPGTELDLLDFDDFLLFAGLSLALLLLIFKAAEVHDLANRGHGVGRNLDQIKPGFLGQSHCPGGCHNTQIFPFCPDKANFGAADTVIDAGT